MNALDLLNIYEGKVGHPLACDEGVKLGDPSKDINSMMFCWMLTSDAIQEAIARGCDTIVAHEAVWFPYYLIGEGKPPEEFLTWPGNRQRLKTMIDAGLRVMRVHSTLDELFIYRGFLDTLGFKYPVHYGKGPFQWYFDANGQPVREIARKVLESLGLRMARGYIRNTDRQVRRIGFPWGGLGLSVNLKYVNELIERGCDLLIAGECDSYTFHYAVEAGADIIETAHETSENPGLKQAAESLAKEFPKVQISYFEVGTRWQAWGM